MSEKYKKYNYLFVEPFPLESVPGYLDVVTKKMDLKTLSSNLDSGLYSSRPAFFEDAQMIFHNAIAYHGTRETKWITKPAKEMIKVVQRELKNLDKRPSKILTKQKAGSIKLKVGGGGSSSSGGGGTKIKKEGGKAVPTSVIAAASAGGKMASTAIPPPAETSTTVKPKSISLKLKTGGSTAKSSKSDKAVPVKAKPTQPKLKLKLSLSKKISNAPPRPPPTAPSTAPGVEAAGSSNTNTKATVKAEKPTKTTKIKLTGPRGKELPEGVTAPTTNKKTTTAKSTAATAAANTATTTGSTTGSATTIKAPAKATTGKTTKKGTTKKTTTTKKTKKSVAVAVAVAVAASTAAPPAVITPIPGGAASMMSPVRKEQCSKILAGLKRRKAKAVSWFLSPVSDKNIIQDYRAKIKHPVCITGMQSKLDKNEYKTVAQFVLDLRRIFANCLRFNTSMKDRLRPLAVELLSTGEDLIATFVIRGQKLPSSSPSDIYPQLLYCWSFCIKVLNTLFNLTNPADGQPTVLYFLHPVTMYCGGQYPPDYLNLVKRPMDFGTITSNLLEGVYQSVDEFATDCRLVIENTKIFYGGREDGLVFIEQAEELSRVLKQQLDAFNRFLSSSPGLQLKAKAAAKVSPSAPPLFPKPPGAVMIGVLEDLRALSYTDKATKITEPAMTPFEKPVSLESYPDYLQYVQSPIDLQAIERKVNGEQYKTPEDFEYDCILVFKNCESYNAARKGDHLVAMAKFAIKQFRRIFPPYMKTFEDPSSVAVIEEQGEMSSFGNKRIKLEMGGGVAKGKIVPRISITAAQVSSAAASAKAKLQTTSPNKNRVQPVKSNQPIPLHIAIARVKEAYPLRRAVKSLQTWEADCARFFKELMRHPWISAARPKFIFHVPVPTLFPELKEAYMMKVRKPMDLTTVECNLLEGNRYSSADDFVQDVALVFGNAIIFNKDGRDVGDPLSCAYYDASVHLLCYARWLSLEILSSHIAEIDTVDENEEEDIKLPPLSWKLTTGNKKKAREEMNNLVLNEPLEKSLEGDRFTWMETECEKLLKALRHQSDLRQMTFFILPNYPPDYAAFIAKPMDWEKCQRTLKTREYDTLGEIIGDLRLIFSNALKYNVRLQGTETVSGRAYDAAKFMSAKLEVAINKLILSVADRLERERIDHANAEREIEAAEQAEEARIRATWKKDATTDGATVPANKTDSTIKIRPMRKQMKRRESMDFEIPFFDDEDDGQHERSYFDAVKQQKALFERQRQDLAKMRQMSMTTGASMFARLQQRQKAKKWLTVIQREKKKAESPKGKATETTKKADDVGQNGSSVLTELEKEGRNPVQVKFSVAGVKKKKKRKRPRLTFD